MNIDTFSINVGQKLRSIRENKTNMNQEEFYEHYLKPFSRSKRNSGQSYQDYMKKLENGAVDLPAQFLAVYADLVEMEISEFAKFIFSDSDFKIKEPRVLSSSITYSSAAKMIYDLVANGTIARNPKERQIILYVQDTVLNQVLSEYFKMRNLLLDGTISKEIFDTWEKGILDETNARLLRVTDKQEMIQYNDTLQALKDGYPSINEHLPITAMLHVVNDTSFPGIGSKS